MTGPIKSTRLELSLSLTVRSPFLFRGLPGKLFGLDASALRDEQQYPIIPADQVRGCLRDAFEDLAAAGTGITAEDILGLFGRQSLEENKGNAAGAGEKPESNKPERGRLIVSDLTARAADRSQVLETTRIAIDDETGAVEEGAMQVLELVARFGAEVTFVGTAILFAPSGSEAQWEARFAQALDLIKAIGAVKSAGYGEITGASVKRIGSVPVTVPASAAGVALRRRYRVTFDRPILVDANWIADNAMQGGFVIPGAVLKGALAQALVYAGEEPESGRFCKSLAALTIAHAFPESADAEVPGYIPIPLSVVTADGSHFGDALLLDKQKGAMLPDKKGKLKPAAFPEDWKDRWFYDAAQCLGYPNTEEPPLIARTHTAITHEGVATDQALFTTLARSVRWKDDDNVWHDRGWILDVACDGSSESLCLVTLLEKGLDGIGKTGARATFRPLGPTAPEEPKPLDSRTGQYAVMLVTPAHLLDASLLVKTDNELPIWTMCAWDAYEAYWEQALSGAKLKNFFAKQKYTGGYLAHRRPA
jgi:hypothetical protein